MIRHITTHVDSSLLYVIVMIMLCPVAACNFAKLDITSTRVNHQLKAGTWGGQNIRFHITDEGGFFEFSCAHGEFNGPFKLDQEGRFDVRGTYTPESHGPTRKGAESVAISTHYWGTVVNGVMNLQVEVDGLPEVSGTYRLARGRQGKVTKCG